MATIAEALTQAMQCHQLGQFPQAEQLYRHILATDPQHVNALYLLGLLAHQAGRSDLAIEHLSTALRFQPDFAAAHRTLGDAFRRQGRLGEAVGCYKHALALRPDDVDACNNLGSILLDQGKPGEAAASLHEALRLRPDFAEAHKNLGDAFHAQGQLDEAVGCYREALSLQPDYPEAHLSLGAALADQKLPDAAIASFRQALNLRLDYPEAHYNLGVTLWEHGRLEEAMACYRQALLLRPDYAEAHNNLGLGLMDQRRLDEAAASFFQALRLRPDYAEVHLNLGNLFGDQGRLEEALASYREALRLRPDYPEAHNCVGGALLAQGRLDEAEAYLQGTLRLKPNHPGMHSTLLMYLNYVPRFTPATLLAEHRCWGERHGTGVVPSHTNAPDPDRRLRVGYVSPDFRWHVVTTFFEPILAHHDPARVEAFCYAEVPAPDATTARLRGLAHGWRSTYGLPDTQVAGLVRADGIDLLVDLAGHTAHNRLLVFAQKPAPVQLTYLGYPNTTGLAAIDYRLTDAVADPLGEPACHTEELWRLPGCFCCYAPPLAAPAVASAPYERLGHVTFGAFHGLAKLNGQVLDLWCWLLKALPTARLLICRDSLAGEPRQRLAQEFERRGIGAGRVELRQGQWTGSLEYLGLYAEVDLLLDTFPWGGHTTACDALWMGVPVLTLAGDRHASRMVSSVLHCLDLAEWVARTPEEFIDRGGRLTEELARLVELRRTLRERMRASPLCDGLAFTRRLEAAYRDMWRRWCAGRGKS